MKKTVFLFCLIGLAVQAQQNSISKKAQTSPPAPPKLVVGIVVDQMGYDFLVRYDAKYGKDGFRRLVREGFSCRNAH